MMEVLLIVFFAIANELAQTSLAGKAENFSTCLSYRGTDSELSFFKRDNSSEYAQLNYQWNTRLGQIEPLGYFVPAKTSDVQNGVRCGRKHDIRLVPKSGGHSYEKYSFGDSDSIVVDLQLLNSIKINPDNMTARVVAGTLIGPLYWNLWTNGGFLVPSTICLSLGVGGVSQGGGYGFFTKRHGLTLDNVVEVKMVDARGLVRVANKDFDKSLFWAVRGGGGGNFGIVTSFKYKLFNATSYSFTQLTWSYQLSSFEAAFEAWQTWNAGPGRENIGFASWNSRPTGFSIRLVDLDLSSEGITNLTDAFPTPDQTPLAVKVMNPIELIANGSSDVPLLSPEDLSRITRHNETMYPYRLKSYFCSRLLNATEIGLLQPFMVTVPPLVTVSMNSFGGHVNQVQSNATAFVHRNSLLYIQVSSKAPDSDNQTNTWIDQFDALATSTFDNGESYQNSVDNELVENDEYLTRFYGSNLERLVHVKKKVDPTNFFRFPQSIPTHL